MSWVSELSTRAKVLLALGLYLGLFIVFLLIFPSEGKNEEFQPQDEFMLDAWIPIEIGGVDLSINRAVFYLVLASALTIWVLV
jgi:F-type H+-transporting ATPase subunit a